MRNIAERRRSGRCGRASAGSHGRDVPARRARRAREARAGGLLGRVVRAVPNARPDAGTTGQRSERALRDRQAERGREPAHRAAVQRQQHSGDDDLQGRKEGGRADRPGAEAGDRSIATEGHLGVDASLSNPCDLHRVVVPTASVDEDRMSTSRTLRRSLKRSPGHERCVDWRHDPGRSNCEDRAEISSQCSDWRQLQNTT